MKLNKLIIKNFLSVQNAALCLADKGLVSIEGINEDKTGSDSNGCGKSSIINAILWCNYGTYAKEGAADDVVNSRAGKDCFVQCEWGESDRVYTISRYRKHSKHRNSVRIELNGKDITKAGAQAVQQQIDEIMGANEMVFRACCFAQQENPLDIPAMTDTKLKLLLEECLPLEDLTSLHEKAIKATQEQRAITENLEIKLREENWKIDHNKKELKEALDARMNYINETDAKNEEVDKKIKLKNLARGIALSKASKGTLVTEIKECKSKLDSIGNSDVGRAAAKLKLAREKVNKCETDLAKPSNKCRACGQDIEDLSITIERSKEELALAKEEHDEALNLLKYCNENLKRKTDLSLALEGLEDRLAETQRNKELSERLEAEISLLQGQKAPAGDNPHTPTVTRLRGDLKAAIQSHKEYQSKLKEAQARLEILKAVQLTYSPKGLRYHILEKVAPRLTTDTNKYLSILSDGAINAVWSTVTKNSSGDYKEKFSIEARMEGRSNFGLLSGGEKRKVRLACFFALQDLIASQATKNIELWCGDEIDVALDPAGMERLMGVLAEKTKTKSTILVISHNQMREWIPNYATVTRKDGISLISGYLNDN